MSMPSNLEYAKSVIESSKAAIFDNDGTLVDSMPIHLTAWKNALAKQDITFSEAQFYSLAGMSATEIIKLLSKQQNKTSVCPQEVIRTRQDYLKEQLPHIKSVQVVVELLDYAEQKRIPVAVASGGQRDDVLDSLTYCGIDIFRFGAVVTAEDVQHGKPHPETFLTVAKRLEVDPKSCVGFEDADKGLQALSAAGMACIDVRLLEGYPLPESLGIQQEGSHY